MLTKTSLIAFAALPLAFSANAETGDAPKYTLAMTISDNGALVGQPKLVVKDGEEAVIEIEPGDGRAYAVRMTVSANDDATIALRSTVNAKSPTLGDISFAPEFRVRSGEEGVIEYGNQGPGIEPLKIVFTVSEVAG